MLSIFVFIFRCDVVSAISIAEKTFHAMTEIPRAPLLLPTHDIEMVRIALNNLFLFECLVELVEL